MLDKLIKYNPSNYCALEISDTSTTCLCLKKEASSFIISKTAQIDGLDTAALQTVFQEHKAFDLVFNTKQVLTKKINGGLPFEKAVTTAFPTIKQTDFYIEVLQCTAHTFVSICRRDYIDTILASLQKENWQVLSFSLGVLNTSVLSPFVKDSMLVLPQATLSFNATELEDISLINTASLDDETYTINGLSISTPYITTLATVISSYSKANITKRNFDTVINSLKDNYGQNRFFKQTLKIGLGAAFILLLFSFSLFSYYNQRIVILETSLQINTKLKEQVKTLSDDLTKKRSLFNDVKNANDSTAFYLDQLGSSLPQNILLNSLSYQPLKNRIKKDKNIQVSYNKIKLTGQTTDNTVFSNWMSQLEQMDWVDDVLLVDYGLGKQKTTAFELIITLK